MIADKIARLLKPWNTKCSIAEQPEYKAWLMAHFSHWPHAADFSTLHVDTIPLDHGPYLHRDGKSCLRWFLPQHVMNTRSEFIRDGLLMIGASPCGDPLVIDTLASDDLTIGFVSHEMLWGQDAPPRTAFEKWPDTLLVFLDRLDREPGYNTF